MTPQKIIVVGGVAGGASCATRLRRLNESAEIIMVERGPYVSFANCGLPYHIGAVIEKRDSLLVTNAEELKQRFNLDVRTKTEAIAIDRKDKLLKLQDLETKKIYLESYDQLILSPGAEPIRPNIPGTSASGVFTLRNIPDMDRILNHMKKYRVESATVVGAGFIGLEVAENLRKRGLKVRLLEKANQVMPLMDFEMAAAIERELILHDIEVKTITELIKIEAHQNNFQLSLFDNSGHEYKTDLLILAIGVKPEITLAKDAGLEIGPLGGIKVDQQFRTNDSNIFAVGDAIETLDQVTGLPTKTPLAGPANRQGRMVADIISGRKVSYLGTTGTSILKTFSLTAASVGLSEKSALRGKVPYKVAWIHGKSHSSYYPNAKNMTLKILFAPQTGEVMGAQCVGFAGVDKRIDVLATAIKAKMTVYDLESLDLAYAPPFSSAKDPINIVGMVAVAMEESLHPTYAWNQVQDLVYKKAYFLDVRKPGDLKDGLIVGAHPITLEDLRHKISVLPKGQPIFVYCQEGYRGYVATRLLKQSGFDAYNLLGGFKLWALTQKNSDLIYKPTHVVQTSTSTLGTNNEFDPDWELNDL